MLISLLFACSDSVMLYSEPSKTWEEDEIDSSRILLRRQDELLDRIQFKGMPLDITRDIYALNIQEVEVPEDVNIYDLIAELEATDEYEFVEPVMYRSIPEVRRVALPDMEDEVRAPNDPFLAFQPNMTIVQARDLSGAAQGAGVIVAVIDTGVSTGGADAPVNILTGYDFVNDDNDATDDQAHGTHVAGTIAQATNNGIGIMGIAPNVSILPVKVLDSNGSGINTDTIDGINYAVQQGADVINLSLGSTSFSAAEESAVNAAVNAGVVVVGATGNDGDKTGNGTYYPGSYTNAIGVTATDMEGNVTDYSNTGSAVDLSAPGGDVDVDSDSNGQVDGILQETINGAGGYNYYFYEGTSMATPHVAGAFASLMASGASSTEAELYLASTAIDYGATGKDVDYGEGEIRIQDALDAYAAGSSEADLSSLTAGDLVITEIMPDPSAVSDWKGEWIELYNNTSNDVNLNGLEFSGSGDIGFTISSDLTVSANDYVVFAVRSSTGETGGVNVDYAYSYTNLKMYNNDSLSIAYSGTTFDSVSWYVTTYGVTSGTSLSTRNFSTTDNDDPTGWCLSTDSYGLGDLGTPGSANNCSNNVSVLAIGTGDLVISEIMPDPTVVDYRGEWFEIYNNTASPINLNGMDVDSAGHAGFTVSSDVIVDAADYVVFATRSDSSNGGITQVDQAYSYSTLKLYNTDNLTISNSSGTIDTVSYTVSSWGVTSGESLTLASLDASDNNSAAYWCNGTSDYGSQGDLGTPGADNDSCGALPVALTTLGVGDLIISEIMTDPTQTSDWRGEWFEIYNNTASKVNLNGLIVSSSGQSGFTLTDDVVVPAGGYVVFANRLESHLNGSLPAVDHVYSYNQIKFYGADSLTIGSSITSTIDTVVYDTDWDQVAGKSMSLNVLSSSSNDSSGSWCAASSTYGSGDFGTPGTINDSCP